jgi:hypothetical protein
MEEEEELEGSAVDEGQEEGEEEQGEEQGEKEEHQAPTRWPDWRKRTDQKRKRRRGRTGAEEGLKKVVMKQQRLHTGTEEQEEVVQAE